LSFQLDTEGASKFCQLTREHTGERFAVLIDSRVLTAPMINEEICGGTGQISGNFTAQSARELAAFLNAGGLPAPVRLIEIRAPDS
jgi:preprotein translocase subunit SecD